MKKLSIIFGVLILLTVLSFAILFALFPILDKESTVATQGIRLINNTTLETSDDIIMNIKVGDLFSDPSATIYRVNEIRRTQTGTVYVVISHKSLKNFNNFTQYLSRPYRGQTIMDIKYFVQGKINITEDDIENFYKDNIGKLDELIEISDVEKLTATYQQSYSADHVATE